MLNKSNIVQEMSLHFSKWMDIRKRLNTSSGGALLHSIADNIENINESIIEYKKDFFIKTYLDKADKIISFLYRGFLGDINQNKIKIKNYERAYNKKDFYETKNTYYIEDNYLYIKEKKNELIYEYEGYPLKLYLKYHHVWNVYDEFATFVGLTRYDKESNKFLLNRIIHESIDRPNSHKQGLKNAIKNAVVNYDNLLDEEITIETLTPYNIKKYQKYFDSIIEELTYINKDVLRAKRWDVDIWEYGFKNIDYIPHLWDVVLEEYVDGTGFNDSLKVGINNKPTHANVKFSFYEKSAQMIEEYIKNKNLNHNIRIELTKYKDQLKMDEAEYKIDAHSIMDITNKNLEIESYKIIEKDFKENVVDLIDEVLPETIESKINMNLKDKDEYKLVFKPKGNNYPMTINNVYKIKNNNKINMMDNFKMHHPFIRQQDGTIINTRCHHYASKRNDFTNITNIEFNNKNNYMEMKDISKKSTLSLNIDGANNKFVNANYNIEQSLIPLENIQLGDFIQTASNTYSTDKKYGELNIQVEANFLSLEIKGKAEIVINNNQVINIVNNEYKTLVIKKESQNKEKLNIKIKDFNNETSIRFPYYKSYDIKYRVQKGVISNINGNLILPNENNNHLIVDFYTYTGQYFKINGVFIGNNTINDKIELMDIWDKDIDNLIIETDCRVEVHKGNSVIDNNFLPTMELMSLKDNQFLKLNLDHYKNISINDPDIIKRSNEYYLVLNKGDKKSYIEFHATKQDNHKKETFNNIFNLNNNDKIYITNAESSFIIKRNNKTTKEKLNKSMLEPNQDIYIINNLDSNQIEASFILDPLGNKVDSNQIYKNFLYISINIIDSKHHIAINRYKMYNTEEKNIDIINNFQDPLEEGKNMYYVITPLNTRFDVNFMNGKDWSVGKNKIHIISKQEINKPDDYETEVSFINQDFVLSKEIHLNRYLDNHDLTNSIITVPEGHFIHYDSKYVNDNIITAPEFFRSETILPNPNNIFKLGSTNIDEIIYMGYSPWNQEQTNIENVKFDLLKKEGIVIFKEDINKPIFIVYTIKIPTKIIISDEILYSKVSIPITAFKKIDEQTRLLDLQEELVINIKELYDQPFDRVDLLIDNPSFNWSIENNIIKIYHKDIDQNAISINPGYYYQNGKEYYMYHTPAFINKKNHDYVIKENVKQKDGYLIFNKESYNFIKNTLFNLNDEDTIFFADYEHNYDSLLGTSSYRITSCHNYNYWKKVNSDLSLVNGLNGVGISISPRNNMYHYAYIDITNHIKNNKYISFYADQTIQAFLGIGLSKKSNINNYANEVLKFHRAGDMLTINLSEIDKVKTNKVYLIITGSGMFDDILFSKEERIENHIKNTTRLNIKPYSEKSERKILLDDLYSYGKHYNTEVNNNVLSTSMNINWMEKEVISYSNKDDWTKCKLKNIDLKENKAITYNRNGEINIPPIEIKENRIIKNIIITINDMPSKNTNCETIVKTGHNIKNIDDVIANDYNTLIYIDGLKAKRYIGVDLKLEANTFINNVSIYIEYKEDIVAKPESIPYNRGKFISKVFDLEKESTYKIVNVIKDKVKETNYISIQIRAARLNDRQEFIWTSWKDVNKQPIFDNYKLFQFQVDLRDKNAQIELNSIVINELGVK